ncbi:protein LATERAL ROOT PRIMORDIUM 1-like, partial [Primulina tabacum]|uniref:protein LATERAL ROOT PRIMORDIUM 1-like n=1 Tax=Primulina tabacum TaxID=48773 RepID=UPI003F598EDB
WRRAERKICGAFLLCAFNFVVCREEPTVVATSRRLQPSDSGAFAEWVASSSSAVGDLSLGFNAGPASAAVGSSAINSSGSLWASANAASAGRYINSGIPPELFFVAPASSFHNQHYREAAGGATINFDSNTLTSSNSAGVGVGVIPLLAATPRLAPRTTFAADETTLRTSCNRGGGGIQLLQQQQEHNPSSHMKKPMNFDHTKMLQSGSSSGGNIGGPSLFGATSCQDCGNQAKKDCTYRRCRSCCKSRGYDCATHVKSTWVPAVCRRERKLTATAKSSQSTSGVKKPRLGGGASQTTTTGSPTTTSNTSPPRSFDTSSSHQDASFKGPLPGQVRAPAVFKCVRVTALDDGEDEFAYQAVVRIGGRVFKGFLYDQGREYGFSNISELHSGGGIGGGSGGRNGASILDPSDVVASTGRGLLGGTSYGNIIN